MTSGWAVEETLSQRETPFLGWIPRKHPLVVTWVTSLVASEVSHRVHVTLYIMNCQNVTRFSIQLTSEAKLTFFLNSRILILMLQLYFNLYGNKCASLSVSDVHHYVIIRKLSDSISNILPLLIHQWEIQTYTGIFLCNVAYTRYNVPWFTE
jgi:hypothetical protein